MTSVLTLEYKVHFQRGAGGQKELCPGVEPRRAVEPGRLPRIAKLMALAIRFESLIREGAVESYAELAALGHVSRARISQIVSLLQLAPDVQEEILFLPRVTHGRDKLQLRQLLPVATILDWRKQRKMWTDLKARAVM